MLIVTEAARRRLLSKLRRRKTADDVALRITRRENGWRLRPDKTRPDDTAFSHEGRDVLLVDATVAKTMDALKLDAVSTDKGARLKVRRVSTGSD